MEESKKQWIIDNAQHYTSKQLSAMINETIYQIIKVKKAAGVSYSKKRKDGWTPEQVQALETMFPTELTDTIVAAIGRSKSAVKKMAYKMNLQRKPAYYMKLAKALKAQKNAGRYKPGHVSNFTNKKVRFASKQGLLYNLGNYQWKSLKLMVWEAHHGEVPAGYVLRLVDGNLYNVEINNIRMITRAENAVINHVFTIKMHTDAEFQLMLAAAKHTIALRERKLNSK